MQRILFVLHLPPPVHGASVVGQCIHDSEVVNTAFDCSYVNLTTASSLEDIGKGGIRKLWTFGKKLWEIRRAIRRVKPDAVYVTPNSTGGPFYKDFVVTQWCKWWSGKKAILHFHNKGVSTLQNRWMVHQLYIRFFKNTEVILLGKPLYEDVRIYVKEENVHYCPNGIPEKKDDVRCKMYESCDSIPVATILFLSNLFVTKGVLELLDALRLLKDNGCRFVCVFVGGETAEIDAERLLQETKKRKLEDSVVYHGKKYGKEKDEYFEHADIFVLPSYTEAFPLTVLEAMQHGLPVVATNVGGVGTAVENGVNGILVGGKKPIMSLNYRPNANELANALYRLLTDKSLRIKMGVAGQRKYEKDFTLERFEQRFVNVINDCMK